MDVRVRNAKLDRADREWLLPTWQHYLHDLMQYPTGFYQLAADGTYGPNHVLDWIGNGPDWNAYVIVWNGERVGFAFVGVPPFPYMDPDCDARLAEFFLHHHARGTGVGESAARQVFARHPGRWEVSEIDRNTRAIAFWRRVIGRATDGAYRETLADGDVRQVFEIT